MSVANDPPVQEQNLLESTESVSKFTDHSKFRQSTVGEHTYAVIPSSSSKVVKIHASIRPPNRELQATTTYQLPPFFFVYDLLNKNEKTDGHDVSEDFVKKFNEHIGNSENNKKAQELLKKMRQLGGLIPSFQDQPIDIPAARLGLSMLTELNHLPYKEEAIDSLLTLLQNDTLQKDGSVNLVSLAIRLMGKINRELFQTEIVDIQIKMAQIYSMIAELLQRHYSKKHINGITKQLKIELIATAKDLEALNTQQDHRLNLYVQLALEGVRRLVDDRKELFDLVERFYHAAAAAGSFYIWDAYTGLQELPLIFKDLDPHLPSAWYNGVLIINDLAKEAKKNIDKLAGIQILVREKYQVFNWKFLYAALDNFYDVAIHGESAKIRKMAFEGVKVLGPDYPGLTTFAGCHELAKYIDPKPMIHLKKPVYKDPNLVIREECVKLLLKVTHESPDIAIRKKAKQLLIKRSLTETHPDIREFIKTLLPKTKEKQQEWIQESQPQPNNVVRIHRRPLKDRN